MTTKVEIPLYASPRVSRRVSVTAGPTMLIASAGLLMATAGATKGEHNVADANAYKMQPIPSFSDDGISARNQRRLDAKAARKRKAR